MKCQVCGIEIDPMVSHGEYLGEFCLCDSHALEWGFCPGCGDRMAHDDTERESLAEHGLCTDCLMNDESVDS